MATILEILLHLRNVFSRQRMEKSSVTVVQRTIRLLTRQTWKRLARIASLFFVVGFIVLIVCYFRLYAPSVHEQNFDQTIQCNVEQIKNKSRTCKNNKNPSVCQLINGICTDGRNLTLFLTWFVQSDGVEEKTSTLSSFRYDFDKSMGQCSIDPCTSSSTAFYTVNQTFFTVFASAMSTHAYLERTAKLNLKTAKIIFYTLIIFTIITCILSVCFILVLHSLRSYQKFIYPVSSSSGHASTYKQAPSIILHRVTPPDNAHHPPLTSTPSNATLTNNSLIVPVEVTPTVPLPSSTATQTLDPASLPTR